VIRRLFESPGSSLGFYENTTAFTFIAIHYHTTTFFIAAHCWKWVANHLRSFARIFDRTFTSAEVVLALGANFAS